jgi:hypothetical protein
MALAFGAIAVANVACSGDDDDDDHAPPDSITISGGTAVVVGSSLQLMAMAVGNDEGDITASSTWVSSSSAKATVSATGLVTGVAAGTTTISATHDDVVGQVVVTVSTGSSATFNATVHNEGTWPHNGLHIYVRVVDLADNSIAACNDSTIENTANNPDWTVTFTGALTSGHNYKVQAVADANGNTTVDDAGHGYESAATGAVSSAKDIDIAHGSTTIGTPAWSGTPCP